MNQSQKDSIINEAVHEIKYAANLDMLLSGWLLDDTLNAIRIVISKAIYLAEKATLEERENIEG